MASELGRGADDELVVDRLLDQLLAIDCPRSTRDSVLAFLVELRSAHGVQANALFEDQQTAELVLRRLAHFVLSLPEAQLN